MDNFLRSFKNIKELNDRGGGNYPGISQTIQHGGNAANTALALAKLGIKPHLICNTDKLGMVLLKYFLGSHGVDLSNVKTDGSLAITTVMEFGEKHTNVMIGDEGSVSNFPFEILDERDLEIISNSDMLCVLNWTLNKKGTQLAKEAFKFAKKYNVKTFFDTGDPSHRKEDIPDLIATVLKSPDLDILGLNENEIRYYAGTSSGSDQEIIKSASRFKSGIHARLDIHTANFSCTVYDKKQVIIPTTVSIKKYRSTGAGDAWNAGDIFGELLGFDDEERLLFANFIAEYYISSLKPEHPTLDNLIETISSISD